MEDEPDHLPEMNSSGGEGPDINFQTNALEVEETLASSSQSPPGMPEKSIDPPRGEVFAELMSPKKI